MEKNASKNWIQESSVEELLFNESYRFDFYQAVRLLEKLYRNFSRKENKRFKEESANILFDPLDIPVKFKSNLDPAFPASDIDSIKKPKQLGDSFEMLVNFMGLAGITGPMPQFYSQLINDIERESSRNKAFREFLDIFNHRLISLMYSIREKHRINYSLKEPDKSSVAEYFYSLIGMGTNKIRNRLKVKDKTLLLYTGLLLQKNRSLTGLQYILSDYFNIKVEAIPMQGRWYSISEDQVTYIGAEGNNQILGESVVLGNCIWDQTAKFEIIVGPIDAYNYKNFLPIDKENLFLPMYELTKHYAGPEFSFDFTFIIETKNLPDLYLDDNVHLGWTSWLPPDKDNLLDNNYFYLVKNIDRVKSKLSDGKKIELGGTVWFSDIEEEDHTIKIRLSSSLINQKLYARK